MRVEGRVIQPAEVPQEVIELMEYRDFRGAPKDPEAALAWVIKGGNKVGELLRKFPESKCPFSILLKIQTDLLIFATGFECEDPSKNYRRVEEIVEQFVSVLSRETKFSRDDFTDLSDWETIVECQDKLTLKYLQMASLTKRIEDWGETRSSIARGILLLTRELKEWRQAGHDLLRKVDLSRSFLCQAAKLSFDKDSAGDTYVLEKASELFLAVVGAISATDDEEAKEWIREKGVNFLQSALKGSQKRKVRELLREDLKRVRKLIA